MSTPAGANTASKRKARDAELLEKTLPVKCSNGDESAEEQAVESAKMQKVNDNDKEGLRPQVELMPIIPEKPPEIPLKDEEVAAIKRKFKFTYQTKLAEKVYKPRDYAMWPDIAVAVFRQQLNITNHKYASDFIRHWFAEHAGLRAPPKKAPQSAYWIFHNDQKRKWAETHGKWNQSRDSKRVGAMWVALSDGDKQVWHDRLDKAVAQFDADDGFWRSEAEGWGRERARTLMENGEETDPERRVRLKLGGLAISAGDFYYYKWW